MGLLTFLALIAAVAAAPFLLSFVVAAVTERENKESSRNVSPILVSFYRLFTVLLCYLLSSYGLMFSLYYARSLTANFRAVNLVVLVWIFAWVCHATMSLAWIINRKLPKVWPISGSVAAIAGLFGIPVSASMRSGSIPLVDNLGFVFFEVLFVLPCLLLAVHLVRFHLGGLEKNAIPQANG